MTIFVLFLLVLGAWQYYKARRTMLALMVTLDNVAKELEFKDLDFFRRNSARGELTLVGCALYVERRVKRLAEHMKARQLSAPAVHPAAQTS